jgi:hypothetical protein
MKRSNRATSGREWLLFLGAVLGLALIYGAPQAVLAGLIAILLLAIGLFALACLASGFAQADPDRALRRTGLFGHRLPRLRKSAPL